MGSWIVTEEVPVIGRVCLRAQGALRDGIFQFRIVNSFRLVSLVPMLAPKNTVMEGQGAGFLEKSHSNAARGMKRLCHLEGRERDDLSRSRSRRYWSSRRRYIESIREGDRSCISEVPKNQVLSGIREEVREEASWVGRG